MNRARIEVTDCEKDIQSIKSKLRELNSTGGDSTPNSLEIVALKVCLYVRVHASLGTPTTMVERKARFSMPTRWFPFGSLDICVLTNHCCSTHTHSYTQICTTNTTVSIYTSIHLYRWRDCQTRPSLAFCSNSLLQWKNKPFRPFSILPARRHRRERRYPFRVSKRRMLS